MSDFTNSKTVDGFTVKLWRGERMALIGMDVEQPEDDLVGFSIEVQAPGSQQFEPLKNRLNFSYEGPATEAVTGKRIWNSTEAPFQKFRWIDFPHDPQGGDYTYRVTKQHMPEDGKVVPGTSITLDISLDSVVYDGFLDVGFTRNFASSQAYADKYGNNPDVIPTNADDGLNFQKLEGDVYQWLGFEAYGLIFEFLNDVAGDETLELDFFAYDLNEPDVVALLEKVGPRLRAIIDDSGAHKADTSAESQAAERLAASAGADHVQRMHFSGLQHNKVLIAKRNGEAVKVLFGSTNFSFRGIYIQANNVLVLRNPEAAGLFAQVFERAFSNPRGFSSDDIAKQWHLVQVANKPPVHLCFSPHKTADLSLSPVGGAIDQATSSVFFCIAFLNQATSGAVRESVDRLEDKSVFSYGISNSANGLNIKKPDGSTGIVDFAFLSKNAPEPFKSEWDGGQGIHEHHKFVVTDFNLPTAKVFTGSSNLSVSGEQHNGDNLIMIEDQKVATSYAIEALRVFDHLHFRVNMKAAAHSGQEGALTLRKPKAISGKPAWFEEYYVEGSQKEDDRLLFSH